MRISLLVSSNLFLWLLVYLDIPGSVLCKHILLENGPFGVRFSLEEYTGESCMDDFEGMKADEIIKGVIFRYETEEVHR